MPHKLRQLIILAFVVLPICLAPMSTVSARTLDEIQADIDAQNASLNQIQGQLSAAEKQMKSLQSSIAAGEGTIPQMQNQIDQLDQNLKINQLQTQQLSDQQKLKQLEEEQRQVNEDRALAGSYIDWRSTSSIEGSYLFTNQLHPLKVDVYQSKVMDTERAGIAAVVAELEKIKTDLANYQDQAKSLSDQSASLQRQKTVLQSQLLAMRSSLSSTSNQVANLHNQANVVQSKISQLSAEQKALQDYEAWILGQNPNANTGVKTVPAGELYFTGKGRDLYQGHGVGMSQFGALGAALKGMTAAQIINMYYANTHIEARPSNISVNGYGTMDSNKYAAGQAEVPAHACEDLGVAFNPNNIWYCWPREAIKAQVIAFRTYGVYSMRYGSICTTAACQVYNGGTSSQWAADATKDQVIISNGYSDTNNVIEALYSSDNNNGWGTANNDTRFSNLAGDGTPVSYLRAVNDSATTYHYTWTDWTYRTDGYTLNPVNGSNNSFKSLLDYEAQDSQLDATSRNFVNDVRNQVGTIAAINFDRDPSGRVKKVIIVGTNGASRTLAGWFFKTIWNYWVSAVKPNGETDFIYSPTFFLLTK